MSRRNTGGNIEADVAHLATLGLDDLRRLWGQRVGAVPRQHSVDLLRHRLAWELQAWTHGGLTLQTRRQLKRLHDRFTADRACNPGPVAGLRPGIVLGREWQGTMHRVLVLDEGFEYRGERFASLSQVARRITGTRWSGPLFFGLKVVAKAS